MWTASSFLRRSPRIARGDARGQADRPRRERGASWIPAPGSGTGSSGLIGRGCRGAGAPDGPSGRKPGGGDPFRRHAGRAVLRRGPALLTPGLVTAPAVTSGQGRPVPSPVRMKAPNSATPRRSARARRLGHRVSLAWGCAGHDRPGTHPSVAPGRR
jgi:hypothetical protein